MKEIQIEIDGERIHGVEWGEASNPPVVCLHGLTNNALGFNEMANTLEKEFHVISLDLPGHGKNLSFAEDQSYSFAAMSKWLHKMITSITSSPVYLIGHSWGAAIALHYSKRYQGMVNGIVMLDGGYLQPSDDASTTLEESLLRVSEWVNENQFRAIEEYEDKKREEIGRWSPEIKEMIHADMDIKSSLVRMRASESTVRAIMKALYSEPFRDVLKDVIAPVYLLRATLPKDSEAIRQEAVNLLQKELTGDCRVSAIPETGHVLHWQKPEEVIARVEQWLTAQAKQKMYGNPR